MNENAVRIRGQSLLQIRGLKISGNSQGRWHEIVRGVDLDLARGEVLGLVGESGAGKSTIGLAAMGFARPGCRFTDGTITFDGKDLRAASEKELRSLWGTRIAYVAQSAAASFNPAHRIIDQTIEASIDRCHTSRQQAEADARDLFTRLRLPNPETIGHRYPHQLSGGQLQRAMTAMAMSCRPDLIIFDEPTTALDVTTQVEVLAAMRNIVETFHTAAIYITHDLAVVAQMAHRVMVLKNGKLVEEAPTTEILAHPKEEYTRSLWAVRSLQTPERPPSGNILEIQNVEAGYGAVTILKDVNVSIPKGRTVAVVGESGSGKSTLGRVITGLLAPRSGRVLFKGQELPPALGSRDRSMLQKIQMVHQSADTSLNPRQRVRELIGRPLQLFCGLRGQAYEHRLAQLMDQIELGSKYLDRLPSELSGGQKQRIGIARALAAEPDLIICDEVTSALDQVVQEDILKLLLKMQGETGVAYMFITHDINTVKAIADDIVVMNRGEVVQQGPKSDVLKPPYPAYTELLLSSVPEMDTGWLTKVIASRSSGTSAAQP